MLTVATVFLDGEISGTPRRIYRISRYLDQKRFRSVVIIPKADGEFAALLRTIGATVFEVDNLVRPRRTLRVGATANWITRILPNILRVRSILSAERADVMHAYGMSQITGPLACLGLPTKVVWHINDDSVPSFIGRRFVRVMRVLSDRVTVSSRALAAKYFSRRAVANLGHNDVLYSTVDVLHFKPTLSRTECRRQLGIRPEEPVIGMIGNVAPAKGQREFIRAAALLKRRISTGVRFLMAGRALELRADYAEEVKSLIESHDLTGQLIQLGYRNDIPDLLNAIDILVVPSIWEPLGVIVMEAMAIGTPIVASNSGGVPEMIRNGQEGVLVPPMCPEAIADAVEMLLQKPEIALTLAKNGHARLRSTFAPEIAAETYERLYAELVGQS